MEEKFTVLQFLDKLISLAVLTVLALPFCLFLLLKLVVDGRPLFYVSERLGLNNNKILVLKLRTMVRDRKKIEDFIRDTNPSGGFQRLDPSIMIYTKLGTFCELLQLVEIPQLVNVLRGDMGLVGNRPLPESIDENLRERFGNSLVASRMSVPPGISGVVQVIGKNQITDHERLVLEAQYSAFIS